MKPSNSERRLWVAMLLLPMIAGGCETVRAPRAHDRPGFRVLTYNVNHGLPQPDLACDALLKADADIVCLQETTREWERRLRERLSKRYPHMIFRETENHCAGGLAFLSKQPGELVEQVHSPSGWFDACIGKFQTVAGPVQVLNVHLRPPVSNRGSVVSGYFTTSDDRQREIEHFWKHCQRDVPTLAVGDFNENEDDRATRWLARQGMTNALALHDPDSPTWRWPTPLLATAREVYSAAVKELDPNADFCGVYQWYAKK